MTETERKNQPQDIHPELNPYELDVQLRQDCVLLGRFPLCDLLLMKDANYPWFILVPRREEVSEIYHLSELDQQQLMRESTILSVNLVDTFAAHKMNIAALGNVVRQLHLHHVVRYENDPAWPAPVWGKLPAKAYTPEQIEDIRQRVHMLLEDQLEFDKL